MASLLNLPFDTLAEITAHLTSSDLGNLLISHPSFFMVREEAIFWRHTILKPRNGKDFSRMMKFISHSGKVDFSAFLGHQLEFDCLRNLKFLDISDSANIFTETSFTSILSNNPQLKYLNVSRCSWVSDFTINSLVKMVERLDFLDISMTNVTDYSLELLKKQPLKYLGLSSCPNLTKDRTLKCLSEWKYLREIDFSYTYFVTMDFLSKLKAALSTLSRVNCRYCEDITKCDVRCLKEIGLKVESNAILESYNEQDIRNFLLKFIVQ